MFGFLSISQITSIVQNERCSKVDNIEQPRSAVFPEALAKRDRARALVSIVLRTIIHSVPFITCESVSSESSETPKSTLFFLYRSFPRTGTPCVSSQIEACSLYDLITSTLRNTSKASHNDRGAAPFLLRWGYVSSTSLNLIFAPNITPK